MFEATRNTDIPLLFTGKKVEQREGELEKYQKTMQKKI